MDREYGKACGFDYYKRCNGCGDCKGRQEREDDERGTDNTICPEPYYHGGPACAVLPDKRDMDRRELGASEARQGTAKEFARVAKKYARIGNCVVLDGDSITVDIRRKLDHHEAMHLAQAIMGACAVMRTTTERSAS